MGWYTLNRPRVVQFDPSPDNSAHPFFGAYFGVPEMSIEEQNKAAYYLVRDADNQALIYDHNAGF